VPPSPNLRLDGIGVALGKEVAQKSRSNMTDRDLIDTLRYFVGCLGTQLSVGTFMLGSAPLGEPRLG